MTMLSSNLLDRWMPSRWRVTYPSSAPRTTVVLGGGGARGLAHLGVMKAIGESQVKVERIVGVSMGALVGAMCAIDTDADSAAAKAIQLLRSPVFQLKQEILMGTAPPTDRESSGGVFAWYDRLKGYVSAHRKLTRSVTQASLLSDSPLVESIHALIPDIDISETEIPLSIVAVDLLSGYRVVLENGPLRLAVQASMAIPGIFPPVRYQNMLLCDIGVIESVPTLIAKSYDSELTIAVDVGQDNTPIDDCTTALDVMMRVDDVCERLMRRGALKFADVIVRPKVGGVAWFDFGNPECLIQAGLDAGRLSVRHWSQTK
ncbi:NTE family protein RssA [Rubripirellula obstinata]|uniref:NTE family protein RssA n=2 Tax=Rubripirellula obstinata TaxID=406547 RepID=A0A5B1CPV8_9BACT|nr:patatin-like phospholipase family protein [Rubripirellula obstinata]KAA1261889.1 NTE family protein RssA [Rubripirellula obstinata]